MPMGEPQEMWRNTEQQSNEIDDAQPITRTVESSVDYRMCGVLSPTGGVHCNADYPDWGSIIF